MDLKLDTAVIKEQRRKRGWSQEQLAAAAGLGVRTIQRMESSGTASGESAKCLAATFEVPLTDLLVMGSGRQLRARVRALWAAAATLCIVIAAPLLFMSRANASDIAMAVVVGTESTGVSRMNVEVNSGRQTEIRLERDLRLLLTPTIRADGTVFLAAELYGWDGTDFSLVATPRLVMSQGKETRLRVGLHDGRTASISITPRVV